MSEPTEKDRRIYYQDIVYDVCNKLDLIFGKRPGRGVVCGTADSPSNQVQDYMTIVVERCWLLAKVEALLQRGFAPAPETPPAGGVNPGR